jgi:hypothetical protein
MRSDSYLSALTCLLTLSSASSIDLAKRKGGGGGSHEGEGSRSSHSSSGGITGRSVAVAATGASSQKYVNDECYDSSLNPAKHGTGNGWIQANETGYGTGGSKLEYFIN